MCPYPGPPQGFTASNVSCTLKDGTARCSCWYSFNEHGAYPYETDDPACMAAAKEVERLKQREADQDAARTAEAKAQSIWWILPLQLGQGTAKVVGECQKSADDPAAHMRTMSYLQHGCQASNDVTNGVVLVECVDRWGRSDARAFTTSEASCNGLRARYR